MRTYGGHLITAAQFCDSKWNTICNAIRTKSDLDSRFYTAWHLPIQDCFVLGERRAGRHVVAIDFNAMYPACLQQQFPKPATLRYVSYNRELDSTESLQIGLYRCELRSPTSDFIRKHNPFRSFFSGRQLLATLAEPVELDLNEFEIGFFRRHFKQIYLVDAVISDHSIAHPLALEVRRSHARRLNYLSQGNKPLADREKHLATLMSSCSHRPSRSRLFFSSRISADEYLLASYGISRSVDEACSASEVWLRGRKGLVVTDSPNGTLVDAPNLRDGSACFLLNQRIVARGRIRLLEMMEKLWNLVPDVTICYVNIDSIHFSVPNDYVDTAISTLRADASAEIGAIKIEAVTPYGL